MAVDRRKLVAQYGVDLASPNLFDALLETWMGKQRRLNGISDSEPFTARRDLSVRVFVTLKFDLLLISTEQPRESYTTRAVQGQNPLADASIVSCGPRSVYSLWNLSNLPRLVQPAARPIPQTASCSTLS